MAWRLDDRTTGVRGLALPVAKPDNRAVDSGNKPQKHVDQVDPNSILHATLSALLGGRACWNVDAAECTKEGCPKDTK